MKKYLGHVALIITAVMVCVLLLLSGCSTPGQEGFAVYLTKDDIPPQQMPALSHVDIAEKPVIGLNDVVTYNAQTHELKLTTNAFNTISRLDVPVRGKSFVVCVDRKPVYWGAFWTPISSISFDGVTIWKPLVSTEPPVITLELGYPSASFYGGEDPRSNPEILKSLEQAGKLVNRLSITDVVELPRSMKGYELYSWLEADQWRFTLITGTNRNKTVEEIISNEDFISEAGWVQIQVVGLDAIKAVLGKLPQKESVFWLAGMRSEPLPPNGVTFALPERQIIDAITTQAEKSGLDLTVQTPY